MKDLQPKAVEQMYEAPAIVYEGKISTRAGNTRDAGQGGGVDLFNNED